MIIINVVFNIFNIKYIKMSCKKRLNDFIPIPGPMGPTGSFTFPLPSANQIVIQQVMEQMAILI